MYYHDMERSVNKLKNEITKLNIPLFDAHADTLFRCVYENRNMRENDLHIDLMRAGAYTPYAQFFAIWTMLQADAEKNPSAAAPSDVLFEAYETSLKRMKEEFQKNSDILIHCLNAADAENAAKQGKTAAFISVEGAELLDCSIDRLNQAYDLGIRAVNLCWNNPNALCGSCAAETERGLSPAGRDFVRRAQELGIIIDLSHASEQTFWDTIEISKKPVMASHSNAKALCGHARNLTDNQFSALVKNGGVAGINLYSLFLSSGKADVVTAVSHIEHFLELSGSANVVIGADLDGMDSPPDGISGIEDMYKIYEALLSRNYSESLVRDIFYNNLMDFVRRAMA